MTDLILGATATEEGTMNKERIRMIFEYLDDLRVSGVTNMYGAGPYVEGAFSVSRREAGDLVVEWMETFSERHPDGDLR